MSYICLLMVLCECACANIISKANFNQINKPDLFVRLHKMFQISFQNSKGQKCYRKFLGVRSELLLSIHRVIELLGSSIVNIVCRWRVLLCLFLVYSVLALFINYFN